MRFAPTPAISLAVMLATAACQPESTTYSVTRAAAGGRLADTSCDSCHMIRQSDADQAQPLASIALKESPDEVRRFLATSHAGIQLSSDEIEDIVAYIWIFSPP
jgi:mono/diheme cytochrome c family protein